ncbi:hypothetical protein [Pseudobacter ginsenosidimutans]|uniref:Uncharacterized protein n=1 Tax=Pseudobacter ginsenosidimutans TaxID=661488 RepID=A0A4Q7ML77_9BACT|nr:hypothetical protein [Pseudobacter ginsenosidimutans]QEC40221.1 hypothetical protein FSB84_00380 [Pseudobacter ginsenosidimutans]RZS69181.1 hypothetical protein EV199_5009 [Pseudobacter ginsenosidimutans]
MKHFTSVFLLITVICSTACNKKGDPGHIANKSDTFQLKNEDYINGTWNYSTGPGSMLLINARIATLDIPAITSKIFDQGSVMVYMKLPAGASSQPNEYTQLPMTMRAFIPGYLIRYTFGYEAGKLRIYYLLEATDAAATVPNVYATTIPTQQFKYTIIPGPAGANRNAHREIAMPEKAIQ